MGNLRDGFRARWSRPSGHPASHDGFGSYRRLWPAPHQMLSGKTTRAAPVHRHTPRQETPELCWTAQVAPDDTHDGLLDNVGGYFTPDQPFPVETRLPPFGLPLSYRLIPS